MGEQQNRTERADHVLAEMIRFTEEAERPSLDKLCEVHPDLDVELREGYAEWLDFGRRLRAEAEAESEFGLLGDEEFEIPSLTASLQNAAPVRERSVWQGSGKLAIGLTAVITLILLIYTVVDSNTAALELYAVRGGGQIEADPLYMGPDRLSAELTFRGRTNVDLIGEKLRVVSEVTGEVLVDYQAEWTKIDGIRLWASKVADYRRERVRLEADSAGVRFKPFTLVMLGDGAWRLDALGFGTREVDWKLGERVRLDPEDLELTLWIGGEARSEIERISVRSSYSAAKRMLIRERTSERNRYAHSLAGLQLKPGETDLVFNVRDNAGREAEYQLPIEVMVDSLLVDVAGIFVASNDLKTDVPGWMPASRSEHGVVLAPDEVPVLRVETRRESDLSWRLFADETEQPSATGSSRQERIHEVALGEALAMLPPDVNAGRLEFRIDEERYILRTGESKRGFRDMSIAFSRSAGRATFTARLVSTNHRQPLISGGTSYTHGINSKVLLEKRGNVTARIFVFLDDPDGHRIPIAPLTVAPKQQLEIPLQLDQTGLYQLSIQSFQLGPKNASPVDRPDESQNYRIVVDDRPPVLDLNGERAIWSKADEELALSFVARLHYESSTDVKVRTLDFRVTEVEGSVDASQSTEQYAGTLEGASPFAITIAKDSIASDGHYALDVNGSDLAGNELESARVEFEVAQRGPALELLRSMEAIEAGTSGAEGLVWRPDGQGFWTLQLKVDDPNGIALVEGFLSDGEREIGIEFRATSGNYVGRVELDSAWSNAQTNLRLSALDRYGNESVLKLESVLISEIKGPVYSRAQVSRGGVPVNAMIRIAGNHDFPYIFGGRGDDRENELFAGSGLAPLNKDPERALPLSFVEEQAAGSIEDFYLDEYEVSNQEFLAFVLDQSGYSNLSNWAESAPAPAPARMAKLLVRLRDAEPSHSVYGVNWDEASAYAKWVGKRLPTWIEWEYAVRGGEQYRPFSSWSESSPQLETSTFSSLHDRGGGVDRTSDTSLWDLGTNLSEWTASPYQSEADRFWIAGGAFVGEVFDFAIVDDRSRNWDGLSVGFRCAQSAELVELRINGEREADGPVWIGESVDIIEADEEGSSE